MTTKSAATTVLPTTGELVLYDTEYTAWEGSQQRHWSEDWEHRELVELGALRVRAEDFAILDEFRCLTVPHINPTLSDYFQDLTGIRQHDLLREGIPLPAALNAFAKFGEGVRGFVSNGNDWDVLAVSADLQDCTLPISAEMFLNIGPAFERIFCATPGQLITGLLPQWVGLPPAGKVHTAIDDADALARTLAELRRTGRI